MIYIFGHKKPDTDSICASIALAYLKTKRGHECEARTLGNINNETKFVLNTFGLQEPKYLNDVKLQIKDLEYDKLCFVNENSSINKGFLYMREKNLSGLPIVDGNNKLKGIVTLKDLAKELILGEFTKLDTSYDNILETVKGNEILRFDDEIKGNILTASFRSTTFVETIKLSKDDILIVGDRHSILEYAIKSEVKLIIVVGDGEITDKNLSLARDFKVNLIKTSYDTYHTAKLINLSNYIKNVSSSKTPISFDQNDYYSQYKDVVAKTRHTNYPVVNKYDECLGLLSVNVADIKHPKQVILVDHNEKTQSADGIEEASIVEIIDHHKLGTLATNLPIAFRSMTVGSTNTVIYKIFKELEIEIPKKIAGVLISGIISDTLLLKSPTTTNLDIKSVLELEKIANINYIEYGYEMFKAGSSLEGKTKDEIIYEDFKKFSYNDLNIGIGQVMTTDIDHIMNEIDDYVDILNEIAQNEYKIVCLFVTDIIRNGSYLIYNTDSKDILKESFELERLNQGHYLDGVVSRKKQMIPPILEYLGR